MIGGSYYNCDFLQKKNFKLGITKVKIPKLLTKIIILKLIKLNILNS